MKEKHDALLTVCELGRIGDIVASEPVYRYLKQLYPDRKLRWYTKADYADLLRFSPAVDEVVAVRDAEEYLFEKKNLPPGTISYELNFTSPALSAGSSDSSNSSNSLGQMQSSSRKGRNGKSSRNASPDIFPSLLEQFSCAAGLSVPDETPIFHFNPEGEIPRLPGPYAVFHCSSNGRSRQWQAKNWRVLAEMFLSAGWHVVEIGLHPLLKLEHPFLIDKTGKADLQTAARIIANAGVFVGIESGFGHIANATGVFGIILTGKLRHYPEYVTYSGRYRKGESCNLVRYYDIPANSLPLFPAQEAVRRFLAGNPMTAAECRAFCLTEQIKTLHRLPEYRFRKLLLYPFERLSRTIAYHYLRHSGK